MLSFGKSVNFEKGLLYDRPMTGLAKNILKSDNATIQKRNLKALNNMSKEAAAMYNTIAEFFKPQPSESRKVETNGNSNNVDSSNVDSRIAGLPARHYPSSLDVSS